MRRTRYLLIAEGIETGDEADTQRALGERYPQAYWYARPGLGYLPIQNAECLAG